MDNMDFNSVDAGQENVVDSQETEQTAEVNSEGSEVATEQPAEKPVQSAEDNARFAEIRRRTESEARDKTIAELYGDQGITTYAQYQEALRQQQEAEQRQQYIDQYGIDPNAIQDIVKSELENHPVVQSAREQARTLQLNNAALELSKVAKELGINADIKSWADVESLPKYELIKNGIVNNNLDIVTAAKMAYFDDVVSSRAQKAQNETIAKLQANGQASPGSLADTGQTTQLYTREQVDAMSVDEINKNYNLVMKSMKTWK